MEIRCVTLPDFVNLQIDRANSSNLEDFRMTPRHLFQNILHYREFDRIPIFHWSGWRETYERWSQEGLPRDVNLFDFFGASPMVSPIPVNLGLLPEFEEETTEETEEYRIFRQGDGVTAQRWKNHTGVPHFIDFL
jgi:hypothetical protein